MLIFFETSFFKVEIAQNHECCKMLPLLKGRLFYNNLGNFEIFQVDKLGCLKKFSKVLTLLDVPAGLKKGHYGI